MSRSFNFAFGAALLFITLSSACSVAQQLSSPEALFQAGNLAYKSGQYGTAAAAFKDSARLQPAPGTLQNLGLAEWQRGQVGSAILAWEQALWVGAYNPAVHENLRFARKAAQVEVPDVPWYEVVSTWLPMKWWPWIGAVSFWAGVAAIILPGVFRLRKAAWHQALAAVALTVFLLCVPAWWGVQSHARLGFVLEKDSGLRLTPTEQAQIVSRLSPGDPVRFERSRGEFCLVRTTRISGWLKRNQVGLLSEN